MGVQRVYGINPVTMARDLTPGLGSTVAASDERIRREESRERRLVYQDQPEAVINKIIGDCFDDNTVKSRMRKFAPFAGSSAFFKRATNEVARTAYMVPPSRRIQPPEQQDIFAALADEVNLNDVMDRAAKMATACCSVFLVTRYVERLERIVIDVVPPDVMTVIPDPDDALRALAFIYDKPVWDAGKKVWLTWHVYWDDEITFQFDDAGGVRPFSRGSDPIVRHGFPRIPIVDVHAAPRFGTYWNYSTGKDAFQAQKADYLMRLLSIRKLKAQGFRKLVVSGDIQGFPKGQIFDEEAAILAPDGASVTDLASEADAQNYMALAESIKQDAASSRGISRARLNAEGADAADDIGLMEQRSEVIRFMRPAEDSLFEVLAMVSTHEHPHFKLAMSSTMAIDYGEIPHRMDRKAVLEIREMEKSAGLRNVLDDVMEDQPELTSEAEAEAEIQKNVDIQAKWLEKIRAMNLPKDGSLAKPGLSPEENGRLGPKVRDQEITKDEASAASEGVDSTATE